MADREVGERGVRIAVEGCVSPIRLSITLVLLLSLKWSDI